MKLKAPRESTYSIALFLGVCGLLIRFQIIPITGLLKYDFWFVTMAFLLLVFSTSVDQI